jgi:hypothetical protein
LEICYGRKGGTRGGIGKSLKLATTNAGVWL